MSVNTVFGHGAGRDQLPESLGAKLSANSLSIVFATDASLPVNLTNDTNYGVVGANTLRTAAEIGNATGAADFNAGNASAQTLRVVVASNQAAIPASQSGTWTVQPGNTANTTAWKVDGSAVTQPVSGTVTANVGTTNGLALDATVAKLNVAQGASLGTNTGPMAQASVTTAAPAYTTGQVSPLSLNTAGGLRVDGSGVTQPVSGTVTANAGSGTFATNVSQFGGNAVATGTGAGGVGIPRVTVSNDSTVGLVAGSAIVGKFGIDQTTPGTTNAVQATNFPATVDTNSGAAGASTPRSVLATRHEAVATPLAAQLSNGTSAVDYGAGISGTTTLRTIGAGRDSTKTTIATNDYTSTSVTNAAYTQLIASTGNHISRLHVFDSSGAAMIIATGAALSEVDRLYIPPGGSGTPFEIDIPSGTRVSIKSLDTATVNTGRMIFTGLV